MKREPSQPRVLLLLERNLPKVGGILPLNWTQKWAQNQSKPIKMIWTPLELSYPQSITARTIPEPECQSMLLNNISRAKYRRENIFKEFILVANLEIFQFVTKVIIYVLFLLLWDIDEEIQHFGFCWEIFT